MSQDVPQDSIARQQRIDLVCDRFEQAFRAGQSPDIEAFVTELPPDERHELLKALMGVDGR